MSSHEPEFSGNGLPDAIRKVHRRIMLNRWLQQWITACNWILAALIILAAMLRFLRAPLIAGGAAIALAAAAAGIRIRYLRVLRRIEAAEQFDIESRRTTASRQPFISGVPRIQSPMLLRQREDTVGRVSKLVPESYFPIRMPAKLPWTVGCSPSLGCCALFTRATDLRCRR